MPSLLRFPEPCFMLCLVMFASATCVFGVDLPGNTIIIEAESGQMEDGVTVLDDDDASGGKATDHERGLKTFYEIDIPKAGDWYLWIRIYCPNGDQDSYWIGMDEADSSPVEDALGEQAARIYSAAGDSVNTAAQPFNIWFWDCNMSNTDPHTFFKVRSPGKYTLWSKGREPGTLLDQLLLTLDQNFSPEEAAQGGPIVILQAVSARGKLTVTWGKLKTP